MQKPLKDLENYLHEDIPITKKMGIHVIYYDGNSIKLQAPIGLNLNHRKTAFGGSLASLGILSAWSVLHLKLKSDGLNCRLVIQKSSMEFLSPVDCDFEAHSSLPPKESWIKFHNTLVKRGKARIALHSKIITGGETSVVHDGHYVAIMID